MSGTIKRNKFIPIFVISMVIVLCVGVIASCQPKASDQASNKLNGAQPQSGSSDTPVESLGSITGEVTLLSEQLSDMQIQQQNEFKEQLSQQAETTKNELIEMEKNLSAGTKVLLGKLEQKVTSLTDKLNDKGKTHSVQPNYQVGQAPTRQGKLRADGKLWITPAGGGARITPGVVKAAATTPDNLFDQALNAINGIAPGIGVPGLSTTATTSTVATGDRTEQSAVTVIPAVTIPPNATLLDSTLFTALVGRVPLDGTVRHPVPFKVITGAENLASNGIYIPGIKETQWSGISTGDGTLKCARGEITSVTFVFQDGRIVTKQAESKEKPLGWITNERGFPCIPGEFVSNVHEVSQQLFLAGAAAGAGDAFAEGELTTVSNSNGGVTQVLTGSGGKYVLGQGLGSGFGEWARYIADRAKDKFDAVVVSPGLPIAININEMIEIDYASDARKVSYLTRQTVTTGGLD